MGGRSPQKSCKERNFENVHVINYGIWKEKNLSTTWNIQNSFYNIDYIDIEGTRLSSEISHTRTDLTA